MNIFIAVAFGTLTKEDGQIPTHNIKVLLFTDTKPCSNV